MDIQRKVVQHRFVTAGIRSEFNSENVKLGRAFLMYKQTTDRSPMTIKSYRQDLDVIWYWNWLKNENKSFYDWTKQEIIAFQSWCLEECQHSSARVRRLKAVMSSMSNYIEDILDTEYPEFKKVSHKIPNPVITPRMEKSVFTMHDINVLLGYLTFHCQYRKACCLALAVCSGRRKAELLRFKLSDFTEDRLVCDGALYKSAPIRTKGRGRDGKKLECYVLAKQFKPYLDRWLAYRERHGIQSDWLFPNMSDMTKPLSPSTLNDWSEQFSELTPLPFYWHSMRHLTVTNFKRSGIPDTVIQEYIGWAETSNMIPIYSDLSKEESFAMYFNADGTYGGTDGKLTDVKL